MPAVAFGFDSQGYGFYDASAERYQIKSKGFYTVLSKSFWLLGPLGVHGGAHYSLEDDDDGSAAFEGALRYRFDHPPHDVDPYAPRALSELPVAEKVFAPTLYHDGQ